MTNALGLPSDLSMSDEANLAVQTKTFRLRQDGGTITLQTKDASGPGDAGHTALTFKPKEYVGEDTITFAKGTDGNIYIGGAAAFRGNKLVKTELTPVADAEMGSLFPEQTDAFRGRVTQLLKNLPPPEVLQRRLGGIESLVNQASLFANLKPEDAFFATLVLAGIDFDVGRVTYPDNPLKKEYQVLRIADIAMRYGAETAGIYILIDREINDLLKDPQVLSLCAQLGVPTLDTSVAGAICIADAGGLPNRNPVGERVFNTMMMASAAQYLSLLPEKGGASSYPALVSCRQFLAQELLNSATATAEVAGDGAGVAISPYFDRLQEQDIKDVLADARAEIHVNGARADITTSLSHQVPTKGQANVEVTIASATEIEGKTDSGVEETRTVMQTIEIGDIAGVNIRLTESVRGPIAGLQNPKEEDRKTVLLIAVPSGYTDITLTREGEECYFQAESGLSTYDGRALRSRDRARASQIITKVLGIRAEDQLDPIQWLEENLVSTLRAHERPNPLAPENVELITKGVGEQSLAKQVSAVVQALF